MSEETVEIVRRSLDAFSHGDIDAVLEAFAPDAVIDWSNSIGFDAGGFRGHGEMRAFMERFHEGFDEIRLEIVYGPVEVWNGLVVTENVSYSRGRGGIVVPARSTFLTTIRDGEQTSL